MATSQRKAKIPIAFRFDYRKASQATACLLRREKNRRMSSSRLLKLLYVADRESIREIGRPIIGGEYTVTGRGPMHGAMLDLIQGTDFDSPRWAALFRQEHYELEMIADPGCGDLSKHDIETLNRVAIRYQDEDDHDLREMAIAFQEIASGDGRRGRIAFKDIVKAVGREQDFEAILRDAKEKTVFDNLFSE